MTSNNPPIPVNWPLLGVPDSQGRLRYPSLAESVRQSIKIILQTRPGERLMRPTFGGGLERYLHEPNTLTTRRQIRDLINESLARWEPRILLDRVDVWEVEERPDTVRVEIVYRLRLSNQSQQMGITLELEG
ncbi:baseplate assembly protein [Candidatus Tenderia electrophaga]|uniref:Baseplate assembly protein n=1 Tax=Candidatus Tenderia electrophaga TaxID=1748243 RepID=A0A0S2TF68_9GAMM|nr:baseplate assembly protein [Candidatus Tenderia electrophaga]